MILDDILTQKQKEITALKSQISTEEYKKKANQLIKQPQFETRLKSSPGLSLIGEIKKASPSAGIIRDNFIPVDIAMELKNIGAACFSVLTDEAFFKGHLNHLVDIHTHFPEIPILRKDFIIDPIQIYEAKCAGAQAVLLIVAALPQAELQELLTIANQTNLDVLCECHNEEEIHKASTLKGRFMVGINNRNLSTFHTDTRFSLDLYPQLRKIFGQDRILIAESGYKNSGDLAKCQERGYDAVLIGEGLASSPEIGRFFK